MASLVSSLYAQPNSPIASAKKRAHGQGSAQKSVASPKTPSNGVVVRGLTSPQPSGNGSSFGRSWMATISALFSPKPNGPVTAAVDEDAMLAMTPDSKTSPRDDSSSKSSTASTESTDGSSSLDRMKNEEYDSDSFAGMDEQADDDGDEADDVFNPYLYMSRLPPITTVKRHAPALPPNSNEFKYTLALDLDETLVHCSVEPLDKPDLVFPVNFNGQTYQIYARKRPYLEYFLRTVAKQYEIVVFTASQQIYADTLLDYLDPKGDLIQHRLFRGSCVNVGGNFIKDLHVLGRDLKSTLLVDNSPHAYAYNIDNGVPIESWFDDDTDTELLKLIGFLRRLTPSCEDVRPLIRNHFKTHRLISKAAQGGGCPSVSPPF